MLFNPSTASSLWDTWLFYENGVHYLFYTSSTRLDRPWDSIDVATSIDGVHFKGHGKIISKADDATYLGTGHTWKVADKYYLNFAEDRAGILEIFFAESDDLLNWTRLPASTSTSRLDPRWYAEAGTEFSGPRWDCIWVIKESDGDYFGYTNTIAKEGPIGLRGTAGSVTSSDGLVFTPGPPVIDSGVWGDKLEIGGVEKIGDQYFMLVAQAEVPLGLRWTAHHPQAAGGMYVLRADTKEGPFVLDPRQPPLLVSAPEHYTYFARFYRCGNEMLSSHHSITPVRDIAKLEPKPGSYLAPLKCVHVDDGVLRYRWWRGNEALNGEKLPLSLDNARGRALGNPPQLSPTEAIFEASGGGQLEIPIWFDLDKGIILECDLELEPSDYPLSAAGILIESGSAWRGTVALADSDGSFSVGPFNGYAFRAADIKPLVSEKSMHQWRVLVRGTLVEYYLDDDFIQAYTLPERPSGRLSFVAEGGKVTARHISVYQMTL